MSDVSKTNELIAELREYATALRASVHVHHTGADLIEQAADALAAPVLPSSTVDVRKIADEMERHRHVMVAPGPHQCSCGFVMSEDPGFSGWAREHKLHVARAVVEAIGGESRGE